jgi:ParB-like chromosome segregation protein Spo0J
VAIEDAFKDLVGEAGLAWYVQPQQSYVHSPGLQLLALTEIQPPAERTVFDRERARCILDGIKESSQIPPVEVERYPESVAAPRPYRLHNGFHRYHLSLALGFTHIPVVERPYFDYEL